MATLAFSNKRAEEKQRENSQMDGAVLAKNTMAKHKTRSKSLRKANTHLYSLTLTHTGQIITDYFKCVCAIKYGTAGDRFSIVLLPLSLSLSLFSHFSIVIGFVCKFFNCLRVWSESA